MRNTAVAIAALCGGCFLLSAQYAPAPRTTAVAVAPVSGPQRTTPAAIHTIVVRPAASTVRPQRDQAVIEAATARMTRAVAQLAEVGGSQIIDLVVSYESQNFEQEFKRIRALGGQILGRYDSLGMMNIRLPASRLYDMAGNAALKVADLNAKVHATSVPEQGVM